MLGERMDTHPIVREVMSTLLLAELEGLTTRAQAKAVAKKLLELNATMFELYIESEARKVSSLDFDGSVLECNRFKEALISVRDRVREWKARELRAIEEGA